MKWTGKEERKEAGTEGGEQGRKERERRGEGEKREGKEGEGRTGGTGRMSGSVLWAKSRVYLRPFSGNLFLVSVCEKGDEGAIRECIYKDGEAADALLLLVEVLIVLGLYVGLAIITGYLFLLIVVERDLLPLILLLVVLMFLL